MWYTIVLMSLATGCALVSMGAVGQWLDNDYNMSSVKIVLITLSMMVVIILGLFVFPVWAAIDESEQRFINGEVEVKTTYTIDENGDTLAKQKFLVPVGK